MGSQNFLADFMFGWQAGLEQRQSARRDEMMRRQAEQEAYQREQDAMDRALQMETLKLKKAEAEQAMKRQRLEDAMVDAQNIKLAGQRRAMPAPTAADIGIQQAVPDVGPPVEQVQVNRPTVSLPMLTGGPDLQMGILTPQEEQAQALAEQQKKMREALGLLDAQEAIKAQYREKPKTLDEIFAEAKARAAGGRAGAPLASASGSLTGEGGKPLLSGEIKTFNEFRSGLNTIDRLSDEVEKTGAASKAGTMVPGILTETMGWGADAKARQAVLDQAKQVVGKAMEGGVLRKEDEAKYMRILPVISDPPSVAKAKLANLKEVMAQDAEIYLETLEAAGRDTKKLRNVLDKQLGGSAPASGGKYKIIEVR